MIDELVRPHFRSFKPYVSARTEVLNAKIFLDANELPVANPVDTENIHLNRYPDPSQAEVRKVLSERLSLGPEMIFAGVGSDEIIDLLVRLFCEPGRDSVAILEPTYGVYKVAADVNAVRSIPIELTRQFQIDLPTTRSALEPGTKLMFLCSPNNPTGNILDRNDIVSLCEETRGIVVVDQAYVEFAPPSDDLARQVARLENLVVLRTFSKAWGLAGIRFGYCVANAQIVSYLMKIKSPYNISAATSHLVLKALGDGIFVNNAIEEIVRERERVAGELRASNLVASVYPSNANFLLAEFQNAVRVYEILREAGIVVRRRTESRLRNCLRLTIGTRAENDRLLSAIRTIA